MTEQFANDTYGYLINSRRCCKVSWNVDTSSKIFSKL